ncbi:MAG: alpha/beta hydrolase [Pseudonocardiaceae bacterium]
MDAHPAESFSCRKTATLQTPDGFQLRCWAAIPGGARAIVILCHGITTDSTESGFFSLIEHRFCDLQLACVRFDFRGHGVSSGSPRDVTLSGQLWDLRTVRSWIDELVDLPVFYLAASFGASAAVHDADLRLSSGLVLINPILDYGGIFARGESEWGAEIVASRIDDDPDIAARIPRSDYVLTRRLAQEIESDDTFEHLIKIPIPTLIFHGTADKLVPIGPALRAGEANRLIEVVVYEGGRHGLKDFRVNLLGQIQSWLLDHV